MTRGIHLKQLTSSDLGLLGLEQSPSTPHAPIPDGLPDAADQAGASVPAKEGAAPAPPRAGPPSNPRLPPGSGHQRQWAAHESDLPPVIDLAAVTREIRLGLEETLRVLDPSATGPTTDQGRA
jgi:hypothetical protein